MAISGLIRRRMKYRKTNKQKCGQFLWNVGTILALFYTEGEQKLPLAFFVIILHDKIGVPIIFGLGVT